MSYKRPRKKNPIISLSLIGGALLFAAAAKALSNSGGGGTMKVLQQNDPLWGGVHVGDSTSSIGSVGCLMVTLTMIRNFFYGTNLLPPEANQIIKRSGGYSGALTIVPVAAQALGLSAPESQRIRSAHAGDPSLVNLVDSALSSGGVAVLHVDHNEGNMSSSDQLANLAGDHFISVFGKQGSNYLAADPAPGTIIPLNSKLAGESMWGSTRKFYNTVGAFQVHKL